MELGPPRTLERPFVLETLAEAVDVPHLEPHLGLLVPAVLLAFEEISEEAFLQADAVIGVELDPMRAAMRLEPLPFRPGAREGLEIAARMQALPAPVRCRQERHLHPLPARRARFVPAIVERMRQDVVAEVAAVGGELGVAQRFRTANQIAGDGAFRPARAEPLLHRFHLHVVPIGPEGRQDAAVMGRIAVPIGSAFPGTDRRQMWRLARRHGPRIHRVVRDAVDANLAVAPILARYPFDAVVEILSLARREMVDRAWRAAGAS